MRGHGRDRANTKWLYLMGVKVSKPLATVQGSLLALISSCRLRAVMSTAKAEGCGAQRAIKCSEAGETPLP